MHPLQRYRKSRRAEGHLKSVSPRPKRSNFFGTTPAVPGLKRRRPNRRVGQVFRFAVVLAALLAVVTVIVMGLNWMVAKASVLLLDEATSPPDEIVMTDPVEFMLPQQPFSVLPLAHAFSAGSGSLLPIVPLVEDVSLKAELENVFAPYRDRFTPHLFFYDLYDHTYVEINGYEAVSAASVIKVPMLWLLYENIDNGYQDRYDPMLYLDYHRTGGAGSLQYKPAGVAMPTYDVARQMIQISDNTCTNIVMDNIGNPAAINRRLASLGLKGTWVNDWLPDLEGTNHVSMYDLTKIYYNLYVGGSLSEGARSDMLTILSGTHNRRLIPAQLPKDMLIYHKTGDIGSALADAGIIQLPDGRAYILAIQVDRPYNDYTARDMIQKASQVVYNHTTSYRGV